MLKFDEVGKKLKNDLILMLIESFFIVFLGGLFSFGFLTNSLILCILIPIATCGQTYLLEKEVFKYWNNEPEIIFTFHLMIVTIFILSIAFSFLFLNVNLLILICLNLFVITISNILFFNYYKGYVECLVHQMQINNSKQQNEELNND